MESLVLSSREINADVCIPSTCTNTGGVGGSEGTKTPAKQKNGKGKDNRKPLNFRSASHLVKLGIRLKQPEDSSSSSLKHLDKDTDDSLDDDSTNDGEMYSNRRRGTIHDLPRDSRSRRDSTRPPRRSMGAIFKEPDKTNRSNSQLLSFAVREDIMKRQLMKKFKFLIGLRVLLHRWWKRHSRSEVSQTHPFYMQYQMINDLAEAPPADSAIDFKASYFKANKQMRMSQEAIRILTMKPTLRSKAEVYYAMIALRGIDSIADYPLRMQESLAAHGMFQSYGAKRIIVKQGHQPECFYFILYGTVVVATLANGEPYAKTRVTLRRGENFGELAIAHRIPRQSTVLTMEYTEFLTIDCDTYENIFMAGGVKTIHDPDHNKFMQSIYFLKDWPMEKLQNNTKAMEFCYFRRNTVMVKDSNISDWIYIVKSGSLRVYKKLIKNYPHVNKRTGNYSVLAHTDGYRSFMSQKAEYHRYAVYNNVDLPPPLSPEIDSDDDLYGVDKGNADEKENLLALPLLQRVERLIRPRTAIGGVISTYGQSSVKRNLQSAKSERSKSRRIQHGIDGPTTPRSISALTIQDNVVDGTDQGQGKRTLLDDYESSSKSKLLQAFEELDATSESDNAKDNDKKKQRASDINPHAISTRHNVFVTDLKKVVTAADLDPEFVLVQTLTKGQAFGVQQLFIEGQPSMTLVSGGAECVMLNKKFYKDNVDPNMAQRLKEQLSPYPTDAELQENLQTRVNWMAYRKITLKNLIARQSDGKAPKLKPKANRAIFK